MAEKANILIIGTSGAGKSTLINTVIGRPVAKVGMGKHTTEKMEVYESDDLNFRLIDSRGFEYNFWNTRKTVKDMRTWLREGLRDKKPRIHMLWFCVDATSKRFTKQMVKTVEEVKKEWKDVPIIVVLTKSFFEAEDEDNIKMVEDNFHKFARKTGMPVAIIPVLAEPPKGLDIVPRGIEELVQTTEDHLDDAIRDAEEAVKRYDLKYKRKMAQLLTFGAATSGVVVGAIPIDFPDAVILTPLEGGLITGISKIYGMDQTDDFTKTIISRIVEAGTVSMVAKTALNQLKLIPGLANVAADVLNAIVAGAFIAGIGEATIVIMEKAYVGNIDKKDLDWINKIVEGKLGGIVKRVTDIITSQEGKISVSSVMKALRQEDTNGTTQGKTK